MKQHSPRFLKLVEEVRSRVHEIDTRALRERLAANPRLNLLDVREESEYAAGHVRGARSLGKGIIERDIEKLIPDPRAEIVLYCGGGYRSALAADNLARMGYTNVHSLRGGFSALQEDGFEMEQGAAPEAPPA